MRDTNRRFKIHTDNYGPSKGGSILYLVRRYYETNPPISLELVWDLSSRNHVLDSLGVNKSFNVKMFAYRELERPTDAIDHLTHTLRNDQDTYASVTPVTLSTDINSRMGEKFIIKEIEEGVI